MGTDTTRYVDKHSILEDILETQATYGSHSLILYSDLADFRYLYLNYIKRSLQSLNEIVLMLPCYHAITDVINNLRNTGINIDKYKKEGSIVIVHSEKAHYILSQEFVGVMIMTKMLLRRLDKLGKAGITIISDITQEYAPYSFICTCIIHLSIGVVNANATTVIIDKMERDKIAAKLVTSGYAMLYYAAISLERHLLPM